MKPPLIKESAIYALAYRTCLSFVLGGETGEWSAVTGPLQVCAPAKSNSAQLRALNMNFLVWDGWGSFVYVCALNRMIAYVTATVKSGHKTSSGVCGKL